MRDDLYEQCSDHMTEKMPSSAKVGSRPSRFLIRSNSSGVRLWAAITSGVIIRRQGLGLLVLAQDPSPKTKPASIGFLDQFVNRGPQLARVYAAQMLVDHFAFR